MNAKWIQVFLPAVSALVFGDGLVRCFIALGKSPLLAARAPLLGIPLRPAVLFVGIIEMAVAFYVFLGKRILLQSAWLAWLATNYLVYRVGLFWTGSHFQWSCGGSLTDPLHLARGSTGFIMEFVLPAVLVTGSYAALSSLWLRESVLRRRSTAQAESPKMFCPSCGAHINFSNQNIGRKMPCPLCRTTINLRASENLKMSSFFCNEHIEFPTHAIGQKISCPHCAMAITLKESP
jgi:hypothetical protein